MNSDSSCHKAHRPHDGDTPNQRMVAGVATYILIVIWMVLVVLVPTFVPWLPGQFENLLVSTSLAQRTFCQDIHTEEEGRP